jgi:hypothetical protein
MRLQRTHDAVQRTHQRYLIIPPAKAPPAIIPTQIQLTQPAHRNLMEMHCTNLVTVNLGQAFEAPNSQRCNANNTSVKVHGSKKPR